MTMTDQKTAALTAAWDARDRNWIDGRRQARTDWLRDHGVPADITYRVEFYAGGPSMHVFMYALDAKGRKHFGPEHSLWHDHDHDACRPAVELPSIMALEELPPAFLLED